jgi:hypothetical protein
VIGTPELLAWLGADSSHAPQIIGLEERVVDIVQRKCGRYFGAVAETTEIRQGDGGMKLRLAEIPAALPATIAERPYPGAEATTITAADDDGYELRSLLMPAPNLAWLVRKNGGVWSRGCEYTVTYSRGYAVGGEPAAIRHLVMGIVQHIWELHKAKGGVIQSETFDKYTYSLAAASPGAGGLPAWAMETIADWQLPVW